MCVCVSVYAGQTDSKDRMKDVKVWGTVACVLKYVSLYMFITEKITEAIEFQLKKKKKLVTFFLQSFKMGQFDQNTMQNASAL